MKQRESVDLSWAVAVAGKPKGEVHRKHGRWRWFVETRGTEQWPRSATIEDVKEDIARICLATADQVTLTK